MRFVCAPAAADPFFFQLSASFVKDLPSELVARSHVLHNAVAGADGVPARLVLPHGATSTFFDAWLEFVLDPHSPGSRVHLLASSLAQALQVLILRPVPVYRSFVAALSNPLGANHCCEALCICP